MEQPKYKPMNPKLKEAIGFIIFSISFFILGYYFYPYIARIIQILFFGLSVILILASWNPISEFIHEWKHKKK